MNYVRKRKLVPQYGKPAIECMVEIEVDIEALADYLGGRAIRNKSKRSNALAGIASATVRETMASKATKGE